MSLKKTVIVVGAGASVEADLPTSAALKGRIAQLLDIEFAKVGFEQISGDDLITSALRNVQRDSDVSDVNQYFRAGRRICDALPQAPSIDSFIDARQGNEEIELCGKLAIVRAILEAEKKSRLYIEPHKSVSEFDFKSVEETWFNAFWQQLSEDCQATGLEDRFSSIVLIIFNYDRCIEHFLYYSIQNYYGLSEGKAACLVNAIEIFHPYGTVGLLPWTGGPAQMAFGAEPNTSDLVTLAKQIKTFTEGTDPEGSEVEDIRNRVAGADTLIFLGFAYHQQNMELLKRSANDRSLQRNEQIRCYGTAYEISDVGRMDIANELSLFLRKSSGKEPVVEMANLKCHRFFERYKRTLSRAMT